MSRETYNYKRKTISIAKQLCYPKNVIVRLQAAMTEIEMDNIMKSARLAIAD